MADEEKTNQGQNEKPFDAFVGHQKRAAEEAAKAIESLLPPEFREHGKAAINESVEGFRILVNAVMDELKPSANKSEEKAEDTPPPSASKTGKTKVKVELN
jgi:hypothetical protein